MDSALSLEEIQQRKRVAVNTLLMEDDQIIRKMLKLRDSIPKDDYMEVIAALEGNNKQEAEILKKFWTEFGFNGMVRFIARRKHDVVPPDWT